MAAAITSSIKYTNDDIFSSTFAYMRRGVLIEGPIKDSPRMFRNKSGIVLTIIGLASYIFSSFSLLFAISGTLINSACFISNVRELFFTSQSNSSPQDAEDLNQDPLDLQNQDPLDLQ